MIGVMSDEVDQPGREHRPSVDVSAALGEAGHETEDLGFAGLPDDAPVVHAEEQAAPDPDAAIEHAATQFPND
jgi:hypothetical protein